MNIEVKNYYEILGVSPDAKEKDIDRAYKKAISTYSGDSLALYSLYTDKEKEEKISSLKEAYHVLIDTDSRRSYDRKLNKVRGKAGSGEALDSVPEVVAVDEIGTEACLSLKKTLAVMDDGDPQAAEHFRILFTKLEQINMYGGDNIFALTSAIKGEGKTTTSINLAYIMSEEFKKKVILIDSDLRKNAIAENYLEDFNGSGLVDVLRGDADLDRAIYNVRESNLYVLPARIGVRNSTELLASPKMPKIIKSLKAEFDYVIIDCPPVIPLADVNILLKMTEAVLLIVQAGKTHKDIVTQAVKSLSKGKLAGIILNGTEKLKKDYYYY